MRSNYKRLGDYIRQVDVRNRDLKVTKLMGVSIQKVIMPSIANIVGTDMSTYKVVNRNQFVYGPVTSRNGDKVSIALFTEDVGIVSQAYTSFEIIDTTELLPEYLMLWFMRPEFDRYARFMSHGSAREIFGWDEMCDVTLPVPSIKVQQQIVDEYNTVKKRIDLNERLIKALEETAQAVYKQWFVDFDFPDENGTPYKTSDGKMIDSELGEIPDGWRVCQTSDIIDVRDGTHDSPKPQESGFPLITSKNLESYGVNLEDTYSISEEDYYEANKRSRVQQYDILFSMIGTIGTTSILLSPQINFAIKNVGLFRTSEDIELSLYMYIFLRSNEFNRHLQTCLSGSTQSYITLSDLRAVPLIYCEKIISTFYVLITPIFKKIYLAVEEKRVNTKCLELLLSKLSATEG